MSLLLKFRATRLTGFVVFVLLLPAALSLPAATQNLAPKTLADDYIQTTFTVEDGLPDNVINAITETANGLLWVGTDSGLASFDGRQFNLLSLRFAGAPAQGGIHTLLESSSGDLWVGTDAGIVLIPKQALSQFDPAQLRFYPAGGARSDDVEALLQSRDGAIWAGTTHGLFRLRGEQFETVETEVSVSRIEESINGNLLLVTGHGFMEWDRQKLIPHPEVATGLHIKKFEIYNVMQDRRGVIWYATFHGLARGQLDRAEPMQPFGSIASEALRTKEDPQGNVWAIYKGTLNRFSGDSPESPAPEVAPRSFWLGQDGEVWIGTNGSGLTHLVRRTVRVYTKAEGLPTNILMSVFAAHDGRLWIGSNCGGLTGFDGQRFESFEEKDGLLNTCVTSLGEDQGQNLWIGTYGGGLFRFRERHFQQYSVDQGLVGGVVTQFIVARDDSLWVATPDGISHVQGGRSTNYTMAEGLSSNQALSLHQDKTGTIWAATQDGIDYFSGDRFVPFSFSPTRAFSLPVAFAENASRDSFAFFSPGGMEQIADKQLVKVTDKLSALDMVESPQHDLWFSARNGIFRLNPLDLRRAMTDGTDPLDYEWFNRSDGMKSVQCGSGFPNLAITPDSKLWVATVSGLAMIDLKTLSPVRRAPRVFVGAVTIGTNTELAGSHAMLVAGTHHVEFHLEAVDLASPEKVRIQYRLDGVDGAWLDADASRTAVYTNIPAGPHAFHLRASGSDGIWDRQGIVYRVNQEPYLYETSWFHLLTVLAITVLLLAAYLARMRQVVWKTRIRLEERIVERERIARDLHDTLLQGVLSVSMQLDVAEDRLPEGSPVKPLLREILDTMRQVIKDGRRALRGLREPDTEVVGLAVAFSRIGREIAPDGATGYRVVTVGTARPLDTKIYDEVYRIAREALVNAFVHARATLIEAEIEYAGHALQVVVRDDGRGIDPHILETGREGHWGLAGMRERAEGMGATLKLRSRLGAGTEVALTVPAAIAFGEDRHFSVGRWFRDLLGMAGNDPDNTGEGKDRREQP